MNRPASGTCSGTPTESSNLRTPASRKVCPEAGPTGSAVGKPEPDAPIEPEAAVPAETKADAIGANSMSPPVRPATGSGTPWRDRSAGLSRGFLAQHPLPQSERPLRRGSPICKAFPGGRQLPPGEPAFAHRDAKPSRRGRQSRRGPCQIGVADPKRCQAGNNSPFNRLGRRMTERPGTRPSLTAKSIMARDCMTKAHCQIRSPSSSMAGTATRNSTAPAPFCGARDRPRSRPPGVRTAESRDQRP